MCMMWREKMRGDTELYLLMSVVRMMQARNISLVQLVTLKCVLCLHMQQSRTQSF